eukprot:TRINITY_DN6543_c0_g1_i1.p1 TRINITY_DN6543_c0_g1~~TRINITY_DN6543_c0_g1_i1.p1  ORF type:complete len:362 (+),score=69.02 TRINITY_DN6543_c0_g1_i1:233-1318(+)
MAHPRIRITSISTFSGSDDSTTSDLSRAQLKPQIDKYFDGPYKMISLTKDSTTAQYCAYKSFPNLSSTSAIVINMGHGCTTASTIIDDGITVTKVFSIGMLCIEDRIAKAHQLKVGSRLLERIKTSKLEVAMDFPEMMKAYGYRHMSDILRDDESYLSLLSGDLIRDICTQIQMLSDSSSPLDALWISSMANREYQVTKLHPPPRIRLPLVKNPRKPEKDLHSDASSDLYPIRPPIPISSLPLFEKVGISENDESQTRLGVERYVFVEGYFQPELIGVASLGICEWIAQMIREQDEKHQDQLWQNIILSGGASRIPNMVSRIEQDLRKAHPSRIINVKLHPHGGEAAFMGACLLHDKLQFQ